MRRPIATTTAAALALALTACGSSSDGSTDGEESGSADLTMWLMERSVPEEAQDWLVEEFESQHEDSTLTIQHQPWAGIVELLQTSLPDAEQTPDLVEVGNTQASTFTSVGAFSPVDDMLDELGGDSLIESSLDAGSWDGTTYTPPLYAGSRIIYYRKDLLEDAGIEVPQTLEELGDAAIQLNEANPENTEGFTGIYLAAADPKTLEGWLFTHGGDYATQDEDGTWKGELSSPESLDGLREAQRVMDEGSEYVQDSNETVQAAGELFSAGRVGFLSGLPYMEDEIDQEMWDQDQIGVIALPGLAEGEPGVTFAGGSNIGISAASQNQELSQEVLKLVYSEEFQSLLASEGGWVPGNLDYADALEGPGAEPFRVAVENSKLTPNTPSWGVVDSSQLPAEIWTRIAEGDDVEQVAEEIDSEIEDVLND